MFNFFKKKPKYYIHLEGDSEVPPIAIYDKKVVIGRGSNHVLVLPDNSISRNHLEISYSDGKIQIIDLGTSNGTKLDGHLIPANIPVSYTEGQALVLGQSALIIKIECA